MHSVIFPSVAFALATAIPRSTTEYSPDRLLPTPRIPSVTLELSGPATITQSGSYTYSVHGQSSAGSSSYLVVITTSTGGEIGRGVIPGNGGGNYVFGTTNVGQGALNFTVTATAYDILNQIAAQTSLSVSVNIPASLSGLVQGPGMVTAGVWNNWSVSASGGTSPYTYQWPGGGTSSSYGQAFADTGEAYDSVLYVDVWDSAGGHIQLAKNVRVCPAHVESC